MKFKSIVGFGDSWMYGDELLDPKLAATDPDAHACWYQNDPYRLDHCFLGLLGKNYGVPVENFGIPGGSEQSAIWSFLYWLDRCPDPENHLVLVAHTDCDRMSWYDSNFKSHTNHPPWDKFVHTAWTEASDDVVSPYWKQFNKQYIAMSTCPELDQLNYNQCLLFFDGQAARRNIPMLQFNIMSPPRVLTVPTLIWPGQCLVRYFLDMPENRNRQYYAPNGHPNEMGHEVIRDRLISEIDRVILSQ